jgi:hypothetical protein
MRITSGGNVGIGTTSPSARLHISGDGSSYNLLRLNHNGTGTNGFLDISVTDTRATIATNYSSTNIPLEIKSYGNTNQLFLATGGNVGIGTSNTSAQFHIYNNNTYSAANLNEATSSAMAFRIRTRAEVNTNIVMGAFDSTQAGLQALDSSTAAAVGFLLNPYGGSIGIGTTSPSSLLHTYTSGDNIIRVQTTGNSTAANYFMTNVSGTAKRYYAGVNISSAGGAYEIYDDTAGASRIFVKTDGNVGIGTTSPATKLEVAGNVSIQNGYNLVIGDSIANPVASTSKSALTLRKFSSGNASTVISASYYIGVGGNEYTAGSYRLIGFGYAETSATTTYPSYIGYIERSTSGYTYGDLIFGTRTTTGASDNPTERMRILSDGNVGIGTTSPSRKLDVNGTSVFRDFTSVFAGAGNIVSNITWLSTDSGLMNIYTGGSATVQLNSNGVSYFNGGNVGIGTTNPSNLLHLYKSSGAISLTLQTGNNYGYFYNDGTNIGLASDIGSTGLKFIVNRNAPDSAVVINSNGNVGIGTTSPSSPLHVYKDAGDGNSIMRLRNTNSTFRTTLLQFEDYAGAYADGFIAFNVKSGAAAGSYLGIGVSTTGSLVVAYGGNVGIGTTSPAYPLDIIWSGSGYGLRVKSTGNYNGIVADTSTSTGGGYFASFKNGTRYAIFGITGAIVGDTSTDAGLYSEAAGSSIRFFTNGSASEKMRIADTGNVGIATTSPSALLHVQGLGSSGGDSVYITNRRGGYFPLRVLVTQGDYHGVLIEHQDGDGSGGAGPSGSYGFKFDDKRISGTYVSHPSASFVIARSNTYNNTNIFEVRPYNTTAAIAVATGGNVGIGTTSPTDELQVVATSGNGITITTNDVSTLKMRNSAGSTKNWGFATTNLAASDFGIYQSTSNNGDPISAGTARLYFNGSGNVGIGTTSPSTKTYIRIGNSGATPYDDGLTIENSSRVALNLLSPSANDSYIFFGNPSAGNAGYVGYENTANRLVARSSGYVSLVDGTGEIIRITGGNVGINTTSPTEKLQVDGYILNRSKLGFVQRHDIVKNGLSFYVDFNNKNCWDPVVDGTPSGTSVKDLSNNKYLVAFSGTATVAAKDGNYGLYGNGAGNYMAVKDYTLSSLPHTWEAWVLADGLSGYDTFWDSGTERPLFGALSANPIFYPDAAVSSVTLSTNKWYHFVVAMASNNTYQFYMNGRQISSTTYGATIRTGTFDMWLGGDASSESWNGYIPIARMYNRQLSATEVMQNYNAEKWRFDNNSTFYHDVATGNVGIGTTSPSHLLEIKGSTPFYSVYNMSGEGGIKFRNDGGTSMWNFVHNNADGNFYFKEAVNSLVPLTLTYSTGRVGIGTTSPSTLFHTYTTTADDNAGHIQYENANTGTGAAANAQLIGKSKYGTVQLMVWENYGIRFGMRSTANSGAGDIYFTTGTDSVQMVIKGSNVGIGTTSPTNKLEIVGGNTTTGQLSVGNTDVTYSAGVNFLTSGTNRGFVGWRHTNSGSPFNLTGIHLYNTDNSNIVFGTNNSVKAVINVDGNLGIGTTSPAYLLDVSGTIRATGDVIAYSDARVKENVKTIEAPLDLVTKLRGVTYTRKDTEDKLEKVGVIAQEVLEVLPQVVQQDAEGKYSVAYGNIVGVLIEAIKELKAEIDELKNK